MKQDQTAQNLSERHPAQAFECCEDSLQSGQGCLGNTPADAANACVEPGTLTLSIKLTSSFHQGAQIPVKSGNGILDELTDAHSGNANFIVDPLWHCGSNGELGRA